MRKKCRTCLCRTCMTVCCDRKNCIEKKKSCENYRGFKQLNVFEQDIKRHMRVLVACEESQRVCMEFRWLGHEAYSCDIEPCSGGHPEWHIQADVLPLLNGNCSFRTVDGTEHMLDGKWDMIIAFPPCTHLCVSGARWFTEGVKPIELQYQARDFFMEFVNADCERIAIENPVGKMSTYYRKPNQIINPFEFGHPEQKKTCLWLKGLPNLIETNNVYEYMMTLPVKERTKIHWMGSGHSKERSKTYPGIAKAMAEQWGKVDDPLDLKYQKVSRHSWQHYGITKERYRQLTEYIQSGRYAPIASQAAHRANETLAEYILLSIKKNLSYEGLEKLWGRGEIERIPYCRTDFYGWRRYAIHLFDLEMRRIGK